METLHELPIKHEAIHYNESPRDDGTGSAFILVVEGKHLATPTYDRFND